MASLFGFSGIVDALATNLETKAVGVANNFIGQGINKVDSVINDKLGAVFGSGFTGGNPKSWLSKANARPDPHLSFDWSIVMPQDAGTIANYVEEVTSPTWTWTGPNGIFRGNQTMYYPDKFDTTPLELVFYEDRLFTASSYILQWMKQVGSPNSGLMNYPSEFKKTITVVAQDAAQNAIASFVYYGCWPTDMSPVSLQSATSERTRISVKMSVDGMALKIGNASSTVSNIGLGRISDFVQGIPQSLASAAAGAAGIALNNAVGSLI